MTPMQQMFLGVGAKKKIYADDVFSTYPYKGTGGSNTINNGINFSEEGGLLWMKNRGSSSTQNILTDTVRGANKVLYSDANNAETASTINQSFNNNGWSMNNSYGDMNQNGGDYISWSFRKAPGFFEILTWTGNYQNNHQISHSLGSVPGFIIIKRVSATEDWTCLHRDMPITSWIDFNQTAAGGTGYSGLWNDVRPTATHLNLGANARVNGNGDTYVGYLFAGGESTAATARSIDFDGSSDYLSLASTSDFAFGTGDFTWECWFKADDDGSYLFEFTDSSGQVDYYTYGGVTRRLRYVNSTTSAKEITDVILDKGSWYHFAAARSSGTTKVFLNGIEKLSFADTHNYGNSRLFMGATSSGGSQFTGTMSNVRIVKGTAVYTSSFRPPTEPLTNITNTKLLCCNNSSTTGSTVTPGTITATGSPTASTDSPFDDPAGFVFGDDGKQNLVKTGSYIGNGLSDGPKVYLGWEPAFLIIRRFSGGTGDWRIFDNMQGLTGDGLTDTFLRANTADAEQSNLNCVDISPTGFEPKSSNVNWNNTNDKYIYIAIRRSDGYCGKPAEAGTDVFAMDAVTGSDPRFISNFPVDFATLKLTNGAQGWYTGARLIQSQNLMLNESSAESGDSSQKFDYGNGWYENLSGSYHGWMWKRHAGMDVVTYKGSTASSLSIPHSLNAVPEMIFLKCRSEAEDWRVYHKFLNGGSSPEDYYLKLNTNAAEANAASNWNDTAPTSTHFTVGNDGAVNNNNRTYLAMLFASVDGISKVGSYTGTGSSFSVTCGFQPRFLIIKRTDSLNDWHLFDTSRGWTSSDNNKLALNTTATEDSGNYVNHNSTGFTLTTSADVNASSGEYIYYAHA